LSFVVAVGIALTLHAVNAIETPLLIAIVLSSTSLGVVVAVLEEADLLATPFGQIVVAGSSLADSGTVALLSVLHHGWEDEPELFHTKIEAIGSGFFIPVFFVSAGMGVDLHALASNPVSILRVLLFLGLMLVVRGGSAVVYRARLGPNWVPAGLMQATSLALTIVAVQVGQELHKIRAENGAALILAGLLSMLIFPPLALAQIKRLEKPNAASP
jgi:Kef-type K+ transport system membrane component KefB